MTRNAIVYCYKGRYIISSLSRTTAGVLIGEEPALVLDGATRHDELGRALLAALRRSRENVAHPTDWARITKNFLATAGVKSWSAFARGSSSALVRDTGSEMSVTPQVREESGQGFVEVPGHTLVIPASEPAVLGKAVEQALSLVVS